MQTICCTLCVGCRAPQGDLVPKLPSAFRRCTKLFVQHRRALSDRTQLPSNRNRMAAGLLYTIWIPIWDPKVVKICVAFHSVSHLSMRQFSWSQTSDDNENTKSLPAGMTGRDFFCWTPRSKSLCSRHSLNIRRKKFQLGGVMRTRLANRISCWQDDDD